MNIEQNTVVTLDYALSDAQGKLLQKNPEPLVYLHGGYGNVFAKIEQALQGQSVGYQTRIELQPHEAFGERDESLLQTIAKAQFPPGVKVGGQLEGRAQDGSVLPLTVVKIKGDKVLLDGNHPLAGKGLRFALKVTAVRAASEVEIAHGHVHGAGGHQH